MKDILHNNITNLYLDLDFKEASEIGTMPGHGLPVPKLCVVFKTELSPGKNFSYILISGPLETGLVFKAVRNNEKLITSYPKL